MSEAELHDRVEEAPQILPLAGKPSLAVLGRDLRLGTGLCDLLAVESSGRFAVIEIKLKQNQEARRAVVGQVLASRHSCAAGRWSSLMLPLLHTS
jgi:RecB family endonuclease NucS